MGAGSPSSPVADAAMGCDTKNHGLPAPHGGGPTDTLYASNQNARPEAALNTAPVAKLAEVCPIPPMWANTMRPVALHNNNDCLTLQWALNTMQMHARLDVWPWELCKQTHGLQRAATHAAPERLGNKRCYSMVGADDATTNRTCQLATFALHTHTNRLFDFELHWRLGWWLSMLGAIRCHKPLEATPSGHWSAVCACVNDIEDAQDERQTRCVRS